MKYGRPYRKKKSAKKFLFFGMVAVVMLFLVGGVVMWLWNAVLPDVLNIKPITYWQAIGLLVLCRILFGGFRMGSFREKAAARRSARRERWMNMTDEERAEVKRRWKERCRTKKES